MTETRALCIMCTCGCWHNAPKVKAIRRRITSGWPDAGPWGVDQLPAYTTIQAGHVLTNEQHVAELLRERILRDSESKGTPANFSAVVNHLISLACVRHETRNGIAFTMHTQIGKEGQQIAHTL
eukprot:135557-Pleurochrysis_carterae.AAC.1